MAAPIRAAEGPHEPRTAHRAPSWGQQHGAAGPKQPGSAHWSWTLALLAFRDRCCKRKENLVSGVG